MVSLKQLEHAVSAVENIVRHTLEFEFEGTRFVLRPLLPAEELEVYSLVKESLEGIIVRHDWTAAKHYNFNQQLGVLSFAIVAMGDLDLSGEYLETDEETSEGVPIQVPKAEALRKQMGSKWSKALMEFLFSKYCELVARVNERSSVKVDHERIDETIARLREQLSTLERLRVPDATPQDVIQSVLAAQAERRKAKKEQGPEVKLPTPEIPNPEPAPTPVQEASQDPSRGDPQEEAPRARRPTYPEEVLDPRNPTQRGRMAGVSEPFRGDSFLDSSNPEAAAEAENLRQMEFLRAQQQAQEARRGRPTPRMAATPSAPSAPPVFRMPPEDLAPEVDVTPAVAVDPVPRTNPRYNPRR